VTLSNARFRAYDSIAKVKLQPFEEVSKTIMQLGIKSNIKLVVETKLEGEQFEEYNPNILKLKVVKFNPSIEYDLKRPETLECEEITINKKEQTCSDVEDMLVEMYGIPKDNLVIQLRHVAMGNQIKGEIYNMPWRKSKKIEEACKFDHGTILYIEEGDLAGKMEQLQWYQEFMKEMDKIHLNINDPREDPFGTVFAVRIEMRKHNTLHQLKEKIGSMFDLKIHEFTVKRFTMNRELKDLSKKLSELGITNNCNVKIEIGKAH